MPDTTIPGTIPDLPETANQNLDAQYQQQSDASLQKHIADKIRDRIPKLKDLSDTDILQVNKRVHLPTLSQDDYMGVMKRVYAKD
jgi:hypothetical protein